MPFAFLAVTLSLHTFLVKGVKSRFELAGVNFHFERETFVLAAVALGGLAFLNIWDFPLYVGLFAGAYLLRQVRASGWRARQYYLIWLKRSLQLHFQIYIFAFIFVIAN